MSSAFQTALERLSPTQRQAVDWGEGPALVLAGPGVGKTTVLTARIARLLESSKNRNFRILALTFTTKAGDEMRSRVEELVPGLKERTVVGTFHSFCAQMLRQHGSHLDIRPDFGVYDQNSDREELLKDALREAAGKGDPVSADDVRWLEAIDQLRSSLVGPQKAAGRFQNPRTGAHVARVYAIYENALQARNIMDFNGMILNASRLAHKVPAVAARIQQSYPYWMIDEFQDTSPAQYRFVRFLAGDQFRNVFAVADDDQIIYQWAGASYKQIAAFAKTFNHSSFRLSRTGAARPALSRPPTTLSRTILSARLARHRLYQRNLMAEQQSSNACMRPTPKRHKGSPRRLRRPEQAHGEERLCSVEPALFSHLCSKLCGRQE